MGLFYYFRFALLYRLTHIIYFLIFLPLLYGGKLSGQAVDSSVIVNNKYDSLLKSDENSMNTLFYKHDNDMLLKNIGPYGSHFYFSNTNHLYSNSLLEEKDEWINIFYKLKGVKPYTNITYINASRKEQIITIKHTQQMGKLLKLNFNLNKISSPGAYNNQEANNTDFKGNIGYKTKNDLYNVEFKNIIQRNFYEENGGLANKDNYESKLFNDERNYQVNLGTSNSFVKRYNYQLNQKINLFKFKKDTTSLNKIYLGHQFNYNTKQRVFYDNEPQAPIYQAILIDSVNTVDSIYTNNLSNILSIGLKGTTINSKLFFQYDIVNYNQSYGIDTSFNNSYLGGELNANVNQINIDLISKYGIEGYRKQDLLIELLASRDFNNTISNLGFGYFKTEPDLKYVNYSSNHFYWRNYNFEKQNMLQFNINLKLKQQKLEFTASTKSLSNALYYDTLSIASQSEKALSFSTFSIAKNYKLWNFFFRTAIIYQLTTNKYIVPLPELVGRQVIYYQNKIFKNALKVQIGIGISYSTDYYGYRYMPALSAFYVQEDTQLGYYPNIDVFLNTHLKRAQIFLKYEHLNAGSSLDKSYQVPGYPQLNRSMKFGVSWNLFD